MLTDREICLFDWDGTLREGFTIIDWIDFLCNKNTIDHKYKTLTLDLFDSYASGILSHDNLAIETGKIYAESIHKIDVNLLADIAFQFIETDESRLFPFARPLLKSLRDKFIRIFIISGAPIEILRAYSRTMFFDKIFGLEIASTDGLYTNNTVINPGSSSSKKKCLENYGKLPVLAAFGNSISDTPLFDAAPKFVAVNLRTQHSKKPYLEIDGKTASPRNIMRFLLIEED